MASVISSAALSAWPPPQIYDSELMAAPPSPLNRLPWPRGAPLLTAVMPRPSSWLAWSGMARSCLAPPPRHGLHKGPLCDQSFNPPGLTASTAPAAANAITAVHGRHHSEDRLRNGGVAAQLQLGVSLPAAEESNLQPFVRRRKPLKGDVVVYYQ